MKGSDGKYHLLWEVPLQNATTLELTVTGVEIEGDGSTLHSLDQTEIAKSVEVVGTRRANPVIGPAQVALMFLTLAFDARADLPRRLTHRVTVVADRLPAPMTTSGGQVAVDAKAVVPFLGPPLEAGRSYIAAGEGWQGRSCDVSLRLAFPSIREMSSSDGALWRLRPCPSMRPAAVHGLAGQTDHGGLPLMMSFAGVVARPRFSGVAVLSLLVPLLASHPVAAEPTLKDLVAPAVSGADAEANGAAPQPSPAEALDRTSPRAAAEGFLAATAAGNYADADRFLDLSAVPRPARKTAARELRAVLDRQLWIEPSAISGDAEGYTGDGLPSNQDSLGWLETPDGPRNVILERVNRDGGQRWVFSAESVATAAALYDELGYGRLTAYLPAPLVDYQLLNVQLWQWIALLLLVLLAYLAALIITRLAAWVLAPLTRRTRMRIDDRVLSLTRGPVGLLIARGRVLGGDAAARPVGHGACRARRRGAAAGHRRCGLDRHAIARRRHREHARAVGAARADQRDQPRWCPAGAPPKYSSWRSPASRCSTASASTSPRVLAGLGVGGIAVALAAQKSIENLFGGVTLYADQPVRVGDFCRFGDAIGTVEDIGLRSTRIRTLDRTIVSVPNAEFANLQLENFSKRDKFWYHPTIGLRYETTPDQLRYILVEVRRMLLRAPQGRPEPGAHPLHHLQRLLARPGDLRLRADERLRRIPRGRRGSQPAHHGHRDGGGLELRLPVADQLPGERSAARCRAQPRSRTPGREMARAERAVPAGVPARQDRGDFRLARLSAARHAGRALARRQRRRRTRPARLTFRHRSLVERFDNDTITVVDTVTMLPVATHAVTTGHGIVVHPRKAIVYSMASFDDHTYALDYETGTLLADWSFGQWPTYGAITADGHSLYIVHEESDNVAKVDTETNRLVAKIAVGAKPGAAAIFEPQ